MGDIIEFTTWPKRQNIFNKITSGAIVFYIKGSRNAAVGLANKPGQVCDYWILLGYNDQFLIHQQGRPCCNVTIPNVLSDEKYKKFWISWFNGEIKLGRNNNSKPFLSKKLPTYDLQYVTFLSDGQAIHWKLILSPQIERPLLRKLDGGLYWVNFNGTCPDDAVIGGYENGYLYVIRAHHQGALTPGKYSCNLGMAWVSWNGRMHAKSGFEILCGYNYQWVKTRNKIIPVGALEGGYSENGHETLYIGRATFNGHIIPGKVHPSYNCCFVAYEGREPGHETYEILVKPHSAPQVANKFYINNLNIPGTEYSLPYEQNVEEDLIEDNEEIEGIF